MIPTLVITGPGGVGKTTVAFEVSRRLEAAGVGHALIDTDELDRIFPAPKGDPHKRRLTTRNLEAVWTNFRDAGASRLILVGVMLYLDQELPHIESAVSDAGITVVGLRAGDETLVERVRSREVGSGSEDQMRRSLNQLQDMDREPAGNRIIVETSDSSVPEIAAKVLEHIGWLSTTADASAPGGDC